MRVSEGGHDIPEEVIRRRYIKGMQNLPQFTNVADYWLIINSSDSELQFIAEGNLTDEITIFEKNTWLKFNFLPNGK